MQPKRLTRATIERVRVPAGNGRLELRDKDDANLLLRASASGKALYFRMRRNGRRYTRRLETMDRDEALEIVARWRRMIRNGEDPAAVKRLEIAHAEGEEMTVRQTLDAYAKAQKLKATSKRDYLKALRNFFRQRKRDDGQDPIELDQPLVELTVDKLVLTYQNRRDGNRKLKITESPSLANYGLRVLVALFNWMIEVHDLDMANPAKKVRRRTKVVGIGRRDRIIKNHHLPDWWVWTDGLIHRPDDGSQHAASVALRMMLLCGTRKRETLTLKWSEVDLVDKSFRLSETKAGRPAELPIPSPLHDMLAELHETAPKRLPWVFASRARRDRLKSLRYYVTMARRDLPFEWSCHDLRRTFATIADEVDITTYTKKRLMNHALGSDVTEGYVVKSLETLREPQQRVADTIMERVLLT